jgi:predicted extracellular nuclease
MIGTWLNLKTAVCTAVGILCMAGAAVAQPKVVISQVYTGGQSNSATFNRDYIEIFNAGNQPQDLSGWSVQYGSATGNISTVTALTGTIAPGQYILIGGASGGNGAALPVTVDISGSIGIQANNAKVALVSSTTALGIPSPTSSTPNLVDLFGFGSANGFEGTVAPAGTITTAFFRAANGCTDTNNNATDFSQAAPAPRNSATTAAPCDGPVVVPGVCCNGTVCTVTTDINTCPGGAASGRASGVCSPSNSCITTGLCCNAGACTIVADAAACAGGTFTAGFDTCAPAACPAVTGSIRISQVYGGGGSSDAATSFNRDFVELFNAGTSPVNITGWTVQYASSAGTTWQTVALTGTIPAGGYYLVGLAATGPAGAALPATQSSSSSISMNGSAGKVALVSNATALSGAAPTGAQIIDAVAYGSGSTAIRGNPTADLSVSTAALRLSNGCTDTASNVVDFTIGTPNPRNASSPTFDCSTVIPGPTGTGTASPATACPTNPVRYTVTVTPAAGSTITSVTGDFTNIGVAAPVSFTPDAAPNTFFADVAADVAQTPGSRTVSVTVVDSNTQSVVIPVSVTLINCDLGLTTGTSIAPSVVCSGSPVTITAVVRPATIPAASGPSTGITVTADLFQAGAGSAVPLDLVSPTPDASGNFTFRTTFTANYAGFSSALQIPIVITDAQGRNNGASGQLTTATLTIVQNCSPSTSEVVISQVYGGGGNTDAPFTNDYVELFNRSANPVDISGWLLNYASASGNFGTGIVIPAGVTLAPGSYYTIQLSSGNSCNNAPCGVALSPAADLAPTTGLNMSATSGRLVLASGGTGSLSIPNCNDAPTNGWIVRDYIGWGGANCSEGSGTAPGGGNTLAIFRVSNGCQDQDQNAVDFVTGSPAPRNQTTPPASCTGASTPTISSATALPTSGCPTEPSTFSVIVNPNGATISGVTADFTSIGGGSSVALTLNAGAWTVSQAASATTTPGLKSIPVSIAHDQGAPVAGAISYTVNACNPSGVPSVSPASRCPGEAADFDVDVLPGVPAAGPFTVTGDFTSIGQGANVPLTLVSGNLYRASVTVAAGQAAGPRTIPVTITDALNRSASVNIGFSVSSGCTPTTIVCCRGATCSIVAVAGDCSAPASPVVGTQISSASSCGVSNAPTPATGCCFADFNKIGGVTIDDIFIYLNAWFATSEFANVGTPGTPNIDDIFIFLNAWFAGCP